MGQYVTPPPFTLQVRHNKIPNSFYPKIVKYFLKLMKIDAMIEAYTQKQNKTKQK